MGQNHANSLSFCVVTLLSGTGSILTSFAVNNFWYVVITTLSASSNITHQVRDMIRDISYNPSVKILFFFSVHPTRNTRTVLGYTMNLQIFTQEGIIVCKNYCTWYIQGLFLYCELDVLKVSSRVGKRAASSTLTLTTPHIKQTSQIGRELFVYFTSRGDWRTHN